MSKETLNEAISSIYIAIGNFEKYSEGNLKISNLIKKLENVMTEISDEIDSIEDSEPSGNWYVSESDFLLMSSLFKQILIYFLL